MYVVKIIVVKIIVVKIFMNYAQLLNMPIFHQYIPGAGREIYPNVLIEDNTKLYDKCSLKGKMQELAFKWAYIYPASINNLASSLSVLTEISCPDSQLYYPAQFGYLTNQQQIIADVTTGFAPFFSRASVWFPANGWVFDIKKKYGVVGSNRKVTCYYHFAVEVQFRQVRVGEEQIAATNDCWSFLLMKM